VAFAVFAAHRGLAALEVRRKTAEGKVHADVGFWGGAIPGNLGELRGHHSRGHLSGSR
jgi:allantoinase